MSSFGLRDIPLERIEDESLGLKDYSEALSAFISKCETPLTIALQGDWGSGKTSLMNLIKAQLSGEDCSVVKTVWFNTWQYSMFGMADELSLSLISAFLEALNADEATKKTVKGLRMFLRVAKGTLPSVVGKVAGDMGEKATESFLDFLSEKTLDAAGELTKLKSEIEKTADKIIGGDNGKRIVFFIDDLDRLLPERAVELLEVFKLFLDVKGCVFVIACDYQVVSQGLKKKFGVGSGDLKGKSFFDKIIQLPFSMPIGLYDIKSYINHLLKQIGMEFKEKELALYVDLVDSSIGFNPRSLKRLFNSLLLLNLVAEKKGLLSEDEEAAQKYEMQKILFATICLQTGYERVYKYLLDHSEKLNQEFLQKFTDESRYEDDEELKQLLHDYLGADKKKMMKLASFMAALYEAVQLEQDEDRNNLSEEEIAALKKVLRLSSITSTESADAKSETGGEQRYINREFIKAMNAELNKQFKAEFKAIGSELFLYQGRGRTDVHSYFTLKNQLGFSRFDVNFMYGETERKAEPCYWIYIETNSRALEKAKTWVRKVLPDLSKNADWYEDGVEFVYFSDHKFPPELSEQERQQEFKTKVTEFLSEALPNIVAYLQNKE